MRSASGKYDAEIEELKKMDKPTLQKKYNTREMKIK